ncbi:MAG: pyridoxamine 5'-phosphate oxidase family protein [Erysipelotrichales bacterium]
MKEMRRKDRQMADNVARRLLEGAEFGILATSDENNQPYGVPLNFVVYNDYIYIHSALVGHKLDNVKANEKACFTVVGNSKAVYDEDYTSYFESVIVFGKATIVEDDKEKVEALRALSKKYLPEFMDKFGDEMRKSFKETAMVKISIDKITGKEKTPFN